jgi:uncharacterized tellurite resistance protein B-like protein
MTGQPSITAVMEIAQILATSQQHNGFAKLNSSQRKLLLAAVLASMIPADGKIHVNELEHFSAHLKKKYQFTDDALHQAMVFTKRGLSPEQLEQATKQLPEMLNMEDRAHLIGMLWDLAFCDHELHGNEEKLVYMVADKAGVPRKRVAEEQAKAVRINAVAELR